MKQAPLRGVRCFPAPSVGTRSGVREAFFRTVRLHRCLVESGPSSLRRVGPDVTPNEHGRTAAAGSASGSRRLAVQADPGDHALMSPPWRTYEPADPGAVPDVAVVVDGIQHEDGLVAGELVS